MDIVGSGMLRGNTRKVAIIVIGKRVGLHAFTIRLRFGGSDTAFLILIVHIPSAVAKYLLTLISLYQNTML